MRRFHDLKAMACAGVACLVLAGGVAAQSNCNGFDNNDFGFGSAFWSIDQKSGGRGTSFGAVFPSFQPNSLVPSDQANIATFFTEASADGDAESPFGSQHTTQFVFRRTLASAPSNGRLRFKFGGQLSYVLNNEASVEFRVRVIVRNPTTNKQAVCEIVGDSASTAQGQAEEGILVVPFQVFQPCQCQATGGVVVAGQPVEIVVIGAVQAHANQPGQSAFIGGPIFFDDFEFCPGNCFNIPDQPILPELKEQVVDRFAFPLAAFDKPIAPPNPLDGPKPVSARARMIASLGLHPATRTISQDAWLQRVTTTGGIRSIIDGNADLNGDGVVDEKDLAIIQRIIRGGQRPIPQADINGDGKVDEKDLAILRRQIRR